MNANSHNPGIPPDDIDLLALIERSVLFFRKFRWLFFIAVIAGLLAGFLTWRVLPTVYKSRMIVHSFTLSNQDYIQVIDNWNSALRKGEHEQLATSFGLSRSVIGNVKQMKGNEIQKVFTAANPNGFYIDVYVTDNTIFGELQGGILRGFENIDFIRRQLAIKKDNLEKLIIEVQKEIHKLDSTKSRIESMLNGKGNYSSSLIIDISGVNRQLIEMNEKLLGYKQDLQFTNAVQVLQDFTPYSRPAGPRLLVWLGLGLIAALCIAYLLALYLSIRAKLKARSRQARAA